MCHSYIQLFSRMEVNLMEIFYKVASLQRNLQNLEKKEFSQKSLKLI